jgi:transcriptional regulator with XRE-family HTH domain
MKINKGVQDMKKLPKLKAAFFEEGITSAKVAAVVGIPKSYLSQAVNGRYNLDEQQKKKIAVVLNRTTEELFG